VQAGDRGERPVGGGVGRTRPRADQADARAQQPEVSIVDEVMERDQMLLISL
jgi:hypothetical protein